MHAREYFKHSPVFMLVARSPICTHLHVFEPHTFGSPCEAKIVLTRSNGYDPTVAAHPANAPLT